MANESAKDRRLIGYLLGQLSETERTETEDRYFADDALFEYLAAVETDLIDAYVRGELVEADRLQFEQRFLESHRLFARIALARHLQSKAVPAAVASAPKAPQQESQQPQRQPPPEQQAQRATASQPASRKTSPLMGAVAAGVIVSGAAAGWWAMQSSSPRAAEAVQVAQTLPAQQPRPLSAPAPRLQLTAESLTPPPSGPVDLVLAPGAVGSRDSVATLTIPAGADLVRLQIDHDGPARERYAVVVSTPQRLRVCTEMNLAPRAAGAKGVILQIPAASLPAGDYLVTLSGGALQARRLEAVADYSLRVR